MSKAAVATSLMMLDAGFFARDTLTVARELVGALLVVGGCRGRIVETEAYTTDAASHALTRRHKALLMSETFGWVYVYRIYGVHSCLNFTTERHGTGAVLIRAVEPLAGLPLMRRRRKTKDELLLASGPGRVCQAFGITMDFNKQPIGRQLQVFASGCVIAMAVSERVGISNDTHLPWRFFERGNRYVSRGPREKS